MWLSFRTSFMTQENALIPKLILHQKNKVLINALVILGGVSLLSLLAQIAIPLPFSPVPITGQTMGVAIISLCFGRIRAFSTLLTYISLGLVGFPIFAQASRLVLAGPTAGYVIGMLLASYVMGLLADNGWTKTFKKTWIAATVGSFITFILGLFWLSFFVPAKDLLFVGLLPFIPGDLIKTVIASAVVYQRSNR